MNPDQPSPSLSSPATKSFDQQNLHLGATAQSIINPMATDGMSFSGRQGLNNSYVQPPSIGTVRPIVISQPSGGGDHYADDQPPSLNAVGRRPASQTGPSFTGNPTSDQESGAGVSLNASRFKMNNPNAFNNGN
ncbi:hypothetical protein L1987_43600 [Smallanthus sonchifolius]|uniref:Uncharacterized protein n=1 Tax=Smallanthus sonchifolius TaxID=185202 RepID=A0ACB9GN30_9ASTR|nr:hypothetical protein L1987_43600 [Smallanthus sonchifolius]